MKLRSRHVLIPVFACLLCSCQHKTIPVKQDPVSPVVSEQWRTQIDWLEFQRDGDFLLFVQRFDRAEESYRKAIEKAEGFGAKDARLARSLTGLARVYMARRDWESARLQYERALSIKKRSYGVNHSDVADLLTELALAKAELGQVEDARRLIDEALMSWKVLGGETAECIFVDAFIKSKENHTPEAGERYAAASLKLLQEVGERHYPQSIKEMRTARRCVEEYSNWLDNNGRAAEAKEFRAKIQPTNEWLMIMGESGV